MRVANLDTYRCRDHATGPGLVLDYGNLADGQADAPGDRPPNTDPIGPCR
jgi:hypothetical protein